MLSAPLSRYVLTESLFHLKFSSVNSLLNDKFSDWSKSIAFADDKINVTTSLEVVLGRVENIVRKGENAGYHNFFKKLLFQGR